MLSAEYMGKGDGDRVLTPELHWLNIKVDGKAQQGRMPSTVCNVEISNADGRPNLAARFFVTVGIDANGKPYASITGLKPNSDTTKRVYASWLDFAALIGGGS